MDVLHRIHSDIQTPRGQQANETISICTTPPCHYRIHNSARNVGNYGNYWICHCGAPISLHVFGIAHCRANPRGCTNGIDHQYVLWCLEKQVAATQEYSVSRIDLVLCTVACIDLAHGNISCREDIISYLGC